MSGAIVPLAIEVVAQLIPLIAMLRDQIANGTTPTPEQDAELDAALDKANDVIQAS